VFAEFLPLLHRELHSMFPSVARLRRLAWCLGLILFVALALACGGRIGGGRPKVVGTVKLNEEMVFHDSKWVVVEARDVGKSLKATDPEAEVKERKTDGRFLLVRYKVSNIGKKAV
jgi:hypothetical protein